MKLFWRCGEREAWETDEKEKNWSEEEGVYEEAVDEKAGGRCEEGQAISLLSMVFGEFEIFITFY